MIQEFDFDPAYCPNLHRDSDEFMLADDADLLQEDIENEVLSDPSYCGTLAPFGWDY